MSLRDQIASDAISVFLNTGEFAELVTYHPHRFYGETERPPRTISAIVIREQIETLSEDVVTNAPSFEVHVANSSTLGISSEEIDTGGDQIEFPPRDGKPPDRRSITRLTGQDNGMLIIECR